MIRYVLQALLATFTAVLVGLAGGLLYGLFLDPVHYTDVDPIDLSQEAKFDYARLIAIRYESSGDLLVAEGQLQMLGYSANDVAQATRRAATSRVPGTSALARLSLDLGIKDPTLTLLLSTATPTTTPTATATPTPTETPIPSATPTETPIPTATATETPIPPLPTTPPIVATSAPRPPAPPPTRVPVQPTVPPVAPPPVAPPPVAPPPAAPPPAAPPAGPPTEVPPIIIDPQGSLAPTLPLAWAGD